MEPAPAPAPAPGKRKPAKKKPVPVPIMRPPPSFVVSFGYDAPPRLLPPQ